MINFFFLIIFDLIFNIFLPKTENDLEMKPKTSSKAATVNDPTQILIILCPPARMAQQAPLLPAVLDKEMSWWRRGSWTVE